MKKLLYVCLIALFGILHTNESFAQKGLGVEAGANFANINGTDFETEVRAGFMAGVYYKMLIASTSLYLQPELLYSQKGWKEGDVTFKLNYLTVNVMLAYYLALQGPINPFIKVGPSLGINTTAKAEFEDQEQDLDDVKGTDVGFIARAGIQINRIEIGARIAQGLSSISDNESSDAKNFAFGFFVGLNF